MSERPILFSAPMVRAILAGTKSQTRLAVRFPKWADPGEGVEFADDSPSMLCKDTGCFADVNCRYGNVGDRLWVRETWSKAKSCNCSDIFYRADGETSGRQTALSFIEREDRWRPSIHMPSWASRITLEVTGVRVERLQEISEADAKAEGAPFGCPQCGNDLDDQHGAEVHAACDREADEQACHSSGFVGLWKQINGPESWAANPWVWVVEFKRVYA